MWHDSSVDSDCPQPEHFYRPFLWHVIETRRLWVAHGLIEKDDFYVEAVEHYQCCHNCNREVTLVQIDGGSPVWMDTVLLGEGFPNRAVDLAADPHVCKAIPDCQPP